MKTYIHPLSDVQSTCIGEGTNIWQFVVVHSSAVIGGSCNIHANSFVGDGVTIGERVTIKQGGQLSNNLLLGNDIFIGENTTFSSDCQLDIAESPTAPLKIIVSNDVSIGANSTILPGVTIAGGAIIQPGAVVTNSVPAYAIVAGNPAHIVGYTNTSSGESINDVPVTGTTFSPFLELTIVHGVTIHKFPLIPDMRGSLTVGEFKKDIPFVPMRYFMIFDVPNKETRGEHAHRECHQFLICIRGSCVVMADDGENRVEVLLDSPDKGVYLPPMTWGVQYKYTDDAILLVFASHSYDADDYIRNYHEFVNEVNV